MRERALTRKYKDPLEIVPFCPTLSLPPVLSDMAAGISQHQEVLAGLGSRVPLRFELAGSSAAS